MKLFDRLKQYPLRQNDDFIRRALSVAIPTILQQVITNMVNLLDSLMVGQLGEATITAVASASKYFLIAFFAAFGLANASGIYIAQFNGAGRSERVRQSYRFSLLSCLLVTLLFMLPAFFMPRKIGAFFTPDTAISDPIAAYMPLVAVAGLFQAYSISTQTAMRCLGDTKSSLYISIVSVFSNGFFNYIFIFGHLGFPAMGVRGAALGTLFARIIESLCTYWASRSRRFCFQTRLRDLFHLPRELALTITRRALPLCINEIGYGSGMAMVFKFYGTRGSSVLAAMNIMGTTSDLFFVLTSGMAVATTVMVSHLLGADELEKGRANAYRMYKLNFFCSLLFALLLFASSFIFPGFYNVRQEVRDMAAFFIRIYALFYIVYSSNAQAYFILRAGGDMRHTLMMDSAYFWLVNIPVVGMIANFTDWSIFTIFLAGQLTDVLKWFVSTHILTRETWVRNLTNEMGEDVETGQ